jgi:hypothetical protein
MKSVLIRLTLFVHTSSRQRWKDMSVDFITGLPLSTEGFNTILTAIDRSSKERHYIPCAAGEEGTSAEETAKLFLRWVYRTHGLPDSIVSTEVPNLCLYCGNPYAQGWESPASCLLHITHRQMDRPNGLTKMWNATCGAIITICRMVSQPS